MQPRDTPISLATVSVVQSLKSSTVWENLHFCPL
jgi:hypothetical protein